MYSIIFVAHTLFPLQGFVNFFIFKRKRRRRPRLDNHTRAVRGCRNCCPSLRENTWWPNSANDLTGSLPQHEKTSSSVFKAIVAAADNANSEECITFERNESNLWPPDSEVADSTNDSGKEADVEDGVGDRDDTEESRVDDPTPQTVR